jgi:hypothetical protein
LRYCEEFPIKSLLSSKKIKEFTLNYCKTLKQNDIEIITSWINLEKLMIYDTSLQAEFLTCFANEYFPNLKVLHVPYIDQLRETFLVSGLKKLVSLSFTSYTDHKTTADFLLLVLKNKKAGIKV